MIFLISRIDNFSELRFAKRFFPRSKTSYGVQAEMGIMRKPSKVAIHLSDDSRIIEDPDELQLLDECSFEWVKAWKAVAKKSTELKAQVCEVKHAFKSR